MRSVLAILIVIAMLRYSVGCAAIGGSDPVTAVASNATLGLVLSHMMDQIQQAIESARNAGLSLEMEGGREVNIAIANAQNAYADSLNLTMDRVDQSTREAVAQLQTLVDQVQNNTFGQLSNLTNRAQQIVNSLPFRQHQPQLTQVLPRFVVPAIQDYPVTLTFAGNFEAASQAGFGPVFVANGHKYSPIATTTQELRFAVNTSDIFKSVYNDKYVFGSGMLNIPWDETAFLGLIHHRKDDQYKLAIGGLPASPGKITILHTVSGTKPETKVFETSEYYQTSGSDGANDDHKDVPYAVGPEPGWHVVKGTSNLNVKSGSECDWSSTFISDDGDKVEYHVTTIHHGIGCAGRAHFTISFTEARDVPTSSTTTEQLDGLKWGDSKVYPYAAGSYTVIFTSFDGRHAEFHGPDATSDPFLRIADQGGSLKIYTADPKTLVWP